MLNLMVTFARPLDPPVDQLRSVLEVRRLSAIRVKLSFKRRNFWYFRVIGHAEPHGNICLTTRPTGGSATIGARGPSIIGDSCKTVI